MYEVFEQLLQKYNVTSYKVSKETGVTQTALSNWKSGRSTPTTKTLQKIADYFGVTIDYLMTGEEKEDSGKYYLNEDTAEIAQAVFENKDLRVLFDAAKDASPEDLKTTYDMLMALKKKERGENEF
ncbi:MAG: helix-turn-helix domain-containing protein [Enterococcus sp.]